MVKKSLSFLLLILMGTSLSLTVFATSTESKVSDATNKTASSTSAKTTATEDNWTLFKSGVASASTATKNSVSNAADATGDYVDTNWGKAKSDCK